MKSKSVLSMVLTTILILTIMSAVASADGGCSIESDRKAQSTDDLLSYRIDDIIGDKPVFLFFYADWCHFCHQQMPIIDELEKEYAEKLAFIHINVTERPDYAEEFGVRALPTMFVISGKNEGGYVKQEISGFTEKERLKEIFGCQRSEVEPHREFYVHSEETSEGCTIGVASGHVTADGRPIFCKVRDTSDERQQLCYTAGVPYDYIGVRSEGGGIFMGMNEAGVATGNSLVKLTSGDAPNSLFQRHILENYDTLDQIRNYIQSEVNAGTCSASGCFPFIDTDGDASIFEVNRADWFLEYDSMDPDREAQGLRGFVVRANEFHQRSDGTDDTGIGGRYESGTYNVKGLIGIGELSAMTITHGNDYTNDFEFVRYGPGRALSEISRPTTRSAIAVHGVAPDEDPELATMWVILGQSNYGIAVPTWVRVFDIPQCLSSGDMYDRAKSLYSKGNEATTQASTFPVEAHTFDIVVNTFLPHWRTAGVPPVAEMTRIEHQIASDAYSLLDCLDNRQSDNKAPHVTFNSFPHELTVDFTLIANDPDGTIVAIEWNFGDGQTSTGSSPSHTYTEPGTYLVSCTVTDDDGVSITDWGYCNVPANLVVNVATDKDMHNPGEPVNVVITVTNNGPDVTLIFPGACFADFSVIDETGMPVYDYPLECFWHIEEVPIGHGETKVLLNDVWNQVDCDGNPVPPGTYYVDGWMVARDGSEHHEAHGALREIELTEVDWGLIARYDANGNGYIDRDELKTAIYDYLKPPIGTVISRDDLKTLIYDYLDHL